MVGVGGVGCYCCGGGDHGGLVVVGVVVLLVIKIVVMVVTTTKTIKPTTYQYTKHKTINIRIHTFQQPRQWAFQKCPRFFIFK